MSVKIMIDSASDITKEEAENLGFLFMPIQVRFGEEEYFDGVDLLPNEFYEKLVTSKDMPQTSLINTFRWTEAFENATKNGDEVVAITLSSKISGTFEAAVEVSKNFNGKVVVVDSLNATLGERLLGLYALSLSKKNLSANEIATILNEKKLKIRLYAVIDTLKYLKKGGRISAATAFFGEMLSIKPIISVIDGKVEVIGKAKGNKKGNQYLIAKVDEVGGIDFDMPYGLLYSGNDKTNIDKFTSECEYLFANIKPDSFCLGCTIGSHIGPGAVGITFFSK